MNPAFIVDGDEIKIPLSKIKLVLLLLIAMTFVALGVFFVLNPKEFSEGPYEGPASLIFIIGLVSILFFGTGVVIFSMQLFNTNQGLAVNDKGIIINPGLWAMSLIEWDNIQDFGIMNISRTKLIAVYLKNPKDYVDQQTNSFKRRLASFSLKNYGTPISITANSLKCNTDELYTVLTDRLNQYNNEHNNAIIN